MWSWAFASSQGLCGPHSCVSWRGAGSRAGIRLRAHRHALPLDRLVECPDVPAAEGERTPSFDQLEKQGPARVDGLGEDLEHHAPRVTVSEHVEVTQLLHRNLGHAQAAL